ncbi:MAG: hypothetical protein M5U34_24115 [Chloroflexi bacterium]|nr:hypothetical protein [Chloroflexota bacterium]
MQILADGNARDDQFLRAPKLLCTNAPIVKPPLSQGSWRLAVPMPPFQP